jgi:hypothetical protein
MMTPKINITRRKFIGTVLITLIAGLNLATARENKNSADGASVKSDAANARLGINLAGIKNYATELPAKKANGAMAQHWS